MCRLTADERPWKLISHFGAYKRKRTNGTWFRGFVYEKCVGSYRIHCNVCVELTAAVDDIKGVKGKGCARIFIGVAKACCCWGMLMLTALHVAFDNNIYSLDARRLSNLFTSLCRVYVSNTVCSFFVVSWMIAIFQYVAYNVKVQS